MGKKVDFLAFLCMCVNLKTDKNITNMKYQGSKKFTLVAHAGVNLTLCKLDLTKYLTLTSKNDQFLSQGLLGLCCSIETRDHIEIITITAVLFE